MLGSEAPKARGIVARSLLLRRYATPERLRASDGHEPDCRNHTPGLVDFEINRKQVSFLTQPVTLEAAWRSIDRILATPTDRATS
jgi:hypothetical protein